MRIAFIGVSHWHAPMYYGPAARLSGVEIVGVSDSNPTIAKAAGRRLGARAFHDYRELIAATHPDFVFAFGRHCDMAEIAMTLIDEGVAFVVEKPAGLNFQQVSSIRDRARAKGAYAGAALDYRMSDVYRKLQAVIADNPVTHASFRFIAGGPYRYHEAGCAWVLDPKLSGGGSTINLSPHFIDMFQQFSHSKPTDVTALMGHFTWNLPIEDYSSMILRSSRSICTIETGYTYPSPFGVSDLRFCIRTTRDYIIVRRDNILEIQRASDGETEQVSTRVSNASCYPLFVTESIDRFAKGLPPIAGLEDIANIMLVIDAAYDSDRAGGATIALNEKE